MILSVRHRTVYRYAKPVSLQPHRIMLRPRESRAVRLLSLQIEVTPEASLVWSHDVDGNQIATAWFHQMTSSLVIDARMEVMLEPGNAGPLAPTAAYYPFAYSADEWTALGALAQPVYADPQQRLRAWTERFVMAEPTDTLAMLRDLNVGIWSSISYQSRDDEGTQTPLETLARGWGSCRDLAVLLAEAARSMGLGARVVSGYLYVPDDPERAGTTHAWTEIFLPGAGWVPFDPTHGRISGANLVPVAVGRDMRHITPIAGSFVGMTDAYEGMSVEVFVTS
jgi:transglutaminase-like putative cysteine protease